MFLVLVALVGGVAAAIGNRWELERLRDGGMAGGEAPPVDAAFDYTDAPVLEDEYDGFGERADEVGRCAAGAVLGQWGQCEDLAQRVAEELDPAEVWDVLADMPRAAVGAVKGVVKKLNPFGGDDEKPHPLQARCQAELLRVPFGTPLSADCKAYLTGTGGGGLPVGPGAAGYFPTANPPAVSTQATTATRARKAKKTSLAASGRAGWTRK